MRHYPYEDVWRESQIVVEIYLKLCPVFVDASEKLKQHHIAPLLDFTYLMQDHSIKVCRQRAGDEVELQYLVGYMVKY